MNTSLSYWRYNLIGRNAKRFVGSWEKDFNHNHVLDAELRLSPEKDVVRSLFFNYKI